MKIYNSRKFDNLPDAILFDTDNTLYDYEIAHFAAYQAVSKKVLNLFKIKQSDFDKAFIEARSQVKSRLEGTAASHNRLLYFQRMLELVGLGSQVLVALDLEQTYWRTFLNNAILYDDLKKFLEKCRNLSIPMALITDLTAQIQFRKIVYFGLDHFFDYIVTSEEAGFDKPSELPFKIALEKIMPTGQNIWMIGDHIECDMAGAKKSIDATTLLFNKGKGDNLSSKFIDASFNKYSKLLDFFEDL
jgi:HAD superfamily hydrolase (TIGR01549 family)